MQTFHLKRFNKGKFYTDSVPEKLSLSMEEDVKFDTDCSILYIPSVDRVVYRYHFDNHNSYKYRKIYNHTDDSCVAFNVGEQFFGQSSNLFSNPFNVKIIYDDDDERTVTFYPLDNNDEY